MALTQSAKTCREDTSAAACLASLLPLVITGARASQVISLVQVILTGSAWVFGGQLPLSWAHVFLTLDRQSYICSLSSIAPQTLMNASTVGSAQSILSVSALWEAAIASVKMDLSSSTPFVKVWGPCSLFMYLMKNHFI